MFFFSLGYGVVCHSYFCGFSLRFGGLQTVLVARNPLNISIIISYDGVKDLEIIQ